MIRTPEQQDNFDRLVNALRAEMPPDFRWSFAINYERSGCGAVGCAMGMAAHLGMIDEHSPYTEAVAKAIGIDEDDADTIFAPATGLLVYGCGYSGITPQMVADKLEALREISFYSEFIDDEEDEEEDDA